MIPGDPCRAVLGERATDAVCDDFIHRYGLDQPIPVQFVIYLGQLASGDLGDSIKHSRPVTTLLVERLPTTVELTLWAMTFAVAVGVPLGLISGYKRNSPADVGTMVFANLGVSIPVFVLGLLLAFVFALVLKDTPFALPPSGRLSSGVSVTPLVAVWGLKDLQGPLRGILDFLSGIYTFSALITGQWGAWADSARHLILPAIALGTIPLAIIARITRSSLLEVLGLDYVRTARAKGLSERTVVLRHATRNAMLPGGHDHRAPVGRAALGRGADRDRVQPVRRRPHDVRGDHRPGLRGHPGVHAADRDRVRPGEPARGRVLRPPRPAGAHPMSGATPVAGTPTATEPAAPLDPTPMAADTLATAKPASLWRDTLGSVLHQRSAVVGLTILTVMVLVTLFAPIIAPYSPNDSLLGVESGVQKRSAPCIHVLGCPESQPQHLFGTDGNFRDVFSRVVYGGRVSRW